MITLTQYKEFPKSEIFERGIGFDGRREVRWVAIKWATGKWSMFYHYIEGGSPWDAPSDTDAWKEWVKKYDKRIRYVGKKFSIRKRAQRLLKCDDKVIKLYRSL